MFSHEILSQGCTFDITFPVFFHHDILKLQQNTRLFKYGIYIFFIEIKIFKVMNTFQKAVYCSCKIQKSIEQSYIEKRSFYYHIQLCLIFIGMYRLIRDSCYKRTILQP